MQVTKNSVCTMGALKAACGLKTSYGLEKSHQLKTVLAKLLLAVWLLLIGSSAMAQVADHTKPVNVKADNSEYNERLGTQTLSGNVEISQGSMLISADKIQIEIKNGALFRISGTGSPITFQQLTPGNELVRGQCNEIIYNTETSLITFKGSANFERPGQKLTGHIIEYNLRELTFKAAGNEGGRVNITLQPGKLNPSN